MKFYTYSIIAVCKETGCMGGAAASKFPGLGAFSPYIRLSRGVIASQGWVNPFLNENVMGRLERGESAESSSDFRSGLSGQECRFYRFRE